MHKPAQVELQLDRPQLPYSETLGPTTAEGSPACYRRRQPNPIRKGPHTPYSLSLHYLRPAATLSHFSNSYSTHGILFLSFLTSLSPLAFLRPMYTFVGPVTHYSCRLGLMVFFAIYTVNSLWLSLLGLSIRWAFTNGPQQFLIGLRYKTQ